GDGGAMSRAEVRQGRAPVADVDYLDVTRTSPGPRPGLEDDSRAAARPGRRIAVIEARVGLVGQQGHPPLDEVQHVQLEPMLPRLAAPRRMTLEGVRELSHGPGGIRLEGAGELGAGATGERGDTITDLTHRLQTSSDLA